MATWIPLFGLVDLRLPPRDYKETNRGSTSLELLFDLATVVAVAVATLGLEHDIGRADFALGMSRFAASFFMIWLAWSNYSWLASGYDDRSRTFRHATLVIMFGSLVLAAGIHSNLNDKPVLLVLVGFSIMRVGLIALWLGAARGDENARTTALRHAVGTGFMQVYWYALILGVTPLAPLYLPLFVVGAAGELAVPAWAGRGAPAA